ncbi:MAG: 23S rRNA pseudouridine(1911/1915/1917) synthase RluD [Gammaproteobacteria bacterium]|nr:23S rRNA pseudouridine(1911/1915/1917) synthase RluD [Gammaproteobacteria bacterium]MBU1628770.1 23S rRNA pseudouridine(1911/1915/1917) synthase RluD [Gammaproteobacteria bacterium]MBU1926228.1 23S rRNA pseudouridine(1911/1915/1917) synthase RluD [Gammaproteobacteria bacterium]
MQNNLIQQNFIVPAKYKGKRIDATLATLLPHYSRTLIKEWIETGQITIDWKIKKPKDKVTGNEHVCLEATLTENTSDQPEDIPLDIVYEDDDLLVINKPVGLVVHPGAGNRQGTLLNALLHHCPTLTTLPRAGIVHRLDKDTSGLLIIAKNLKTHTALVDQLQKRKISREYEAIVYGTFTGGGTIDAPIGRDPHHRTRMAITDKGKPAITHYRIIEHFSSHTHIAVRLETGRTHQIRVHMTSLHHPLVGDMTYGNKTRLPKQASEECTRVLRGMKRQALHARRLKLTHPTTKESIEFESSLPEDMQTLLRVLRENKTPVPRHSRFAVNPAQRHPRESGDQEKTIEHENPATVKNNDKKQQGESS